MKVGEIIESFGVFKEEANVVIQVKRPGPKAGVKRIPIKEVTVDSNVGVVVLIAKD